MKIACVAAIAGMAFAASADIYPVEVYEVPSFEFGSGSSPENPSGNSYWFIPGIGGAGGFAASGAYVDSVFDGNPQVIGTDVAGSDITSSQSVSPNSGQFGIYDLTMTLSSSGELWPGGFVVGGQPATAGGLFMGSNGGGLNLSFPGPVFVNSAIITLFNAAGGVAGGPFDITAFGTFTAGPLGDWLGNFGVSFGAGSAGAGIVSAVVSMNVFVTPTPASVAVLGLAGLAAARRRR
ncbi:MAG: hypothetical protein KF866_09215 [Phycisphaeraceae bacterium]|nr:hypothetical protein [Phycisphaeraceae bacterium]